MYFEERHKNHQKNGYFLCFLTNTKIIRSQRGFFVCIFAENPPLFFQTGFVRRFFAPVFIVQAVIARPTSFLFCPPDVKPHLFYRQCLLRATSIQRCLACGKKRERKIKEKFIALFCVDFCAENFLFAAIGR